MLHLSVTNEVPCARQSQDSIEESERLQTRTLDCANLLRPDGFKGPIRAGVRNRSA